MNTLSFQEYLDEKLKDPEFRRGFQRERLKLHLGYRIFLARKKLGMTQGQLARKIGTRQSNISRLEQGNYNFTVEMLEKIASALNLKLEITFSTKHLKKAA